MENKQSNWVCDGFRWRLSHLGHEHPRPLSRTDFVQLETKKARLRVTRNRRSNEPPVLNSTVAGPDRRVGGQVRLLHRELMSSSRKITSSSGELLSQQFVANSEKNRAATCCEWFMYAN